MNGRPIRKIYYSSKFLRSLADMPPFVKKAFLKRESSFVTNAFHPGLETHKLHGMYKDFWSFTVIGQYRIMFSFENDGGANFINIGTHAIYK